MNAVDYNKSRGYTADTWRAVQAEVGVTPDGIPGARTADAVKIWQHTRDLFADGKVGPDTLQALIGEGGEELDAVSVPFGVWWDHTAGMTTAEAVDFFASIGIDRVCVMLDRVPDPPYEAVPEWKHTDLTQLEAIRDACAARCIAVEAAVWPLPRPEHMNALIDGLAPRLKALGASRVQLDVEGNWEEVDVEGFADLRAAAESLVKRVRALGAGVVVTSFPGHADFGRNPSFAYIIDAEIPQAYSRYKKGDPAYQVGGAYGPGNMQAYARKRAATVDACALEMGLAAWDQSKLYSKPETAINVAVRSAVEEGAEVVWFWSSKHVIGTKYAGRAIKALNTPPAS